MSSGDSSNIISKAVSAPTSRRSVLKWLTRAGAVAGANLFPSLAAGKEIFDALTELGAGQIPQAFVGGVLQSFKRLAIKNVMPEPHIPEGRLDPLYYHAVDFDGYNWSMVHLLRLDPKERAALANTSVVRRMLSAENESSPLIGRRFLDSSILHSDEKMMEGSYRAWKDLRHTLAGKNLGSFPQQLLEEPQSWPAWAYFDRKPPKDAALGPPAWWHELDERGKFGVWAEAFCARFNNKPLGKFFKDDDPRLLEILENNLLFAEEDPGNPARRTVSYSDCLAACGPTQGPKEFLRAREFTYRVEGLPLEEARAKAKRDLEESKTPPIISVVPADDFFAPSGAASYEARLVKPGSGFTGTVQLWTVVCHLALSLFSDDLELATKSRFDWIRNGIRIRVPHGSSFHMRLDHARNDCYGWDLAWFAEQPFGLDPDFSRLAAQRRDPASYLKNYVPPPDPLDPLRNEDFRRFSPRWDEASP